MSLTVKGTVQRAHMGPGTWALVTAEGISYELYNPPADLLQPGLMVQVQGTLREDVMTIAMIGPVLEVNTFNVMA